jgi:hypothetical protein
MRLIGPLLVVVTARDNGTPPLEDSEMFTVTVIDAGFTAGLGASTKDARTEGHGFTRKNTD